ncbi:MAG: 5-oxoprolinase subunit PxpB [Gammaproteobacteria bacterium]|jgi:KipI family sensor histidine kinase inhibitor
MNTASKIKTNFKWNGDAAITIFFDEHTGEELIKTIQSLAEVFRKTLPNELVDAIPAYQSLTLYLDILNTDVNSIEFSVKEIIEKHLREEIKSHKSNLIEIPVCYDEEYGTDLISLAEQCNLSIVEVIKLHTQEHYLVNMLGFLPGFLYLSGLNKQLHCPRKSIPSLKVPVGAVAIGGGQTGVYPVESPGGWHIIGQTPISIFNPKAENPFIAQPLDKIRFVSISREDYEQLSKKAE